MKLWMSGELQTDIGDAYRFARIFIEESVNEKLNGLSLDSDLRQWAFIAIIMKDADSAGYHEIARRHKRDKSLEFRYKIDYVEFANSSAVRQCHLIINALRRSVDDMERLGMSDKDRRILHSVLSEVDDNRDEMSRPTQHRH